MKLWMSGLDYERTEMALRERLSFPTERVRTLDRAIAGTEGVTGAVLLSTCNRTELYLTAEDDIASPGHLLCQAAGEDWSVFASCFVTREGEDAARHLLEVASGLRSQIWGEDQIITQVGRAIELAQEVESANAVLSTLFRTAVAAGKDVKTHVRLTAVPSSAAEEAVALLRQRLDGLENRQAVVIGNGEMGRRAARLLRAAGCQVTVTLRTYRHGETVVPFGCETVAYDRRYTAIDGADILFSATTSPHYTVTRDRLERLTVCPAWVVDLAVPRDVEPAVGTLEGVSLFNVDDFSGAPQTSDTEGLAQAEQILERHLREFYQWWDYRECIPAMAEVKAALGRRFAAEGAENCQPIVDKTVDLLLGGLKGRVRAADLRECAAKIDAFTRPRRGNAGKETPFRFPVFTDLRGKKVVIVGGGAVARRRIDTLRPFGPELAVIAPELEGDSRGLDWHQRPYHSGDLEGAVLVIAASDSREVNRQVGQEARQLGIPVSVADRREECTFFFPAICQGETVLAGVVSRGEDHRATAAAAKRIRSLLEEEQL
ncbi:MAG: glutamyl-tRNA reductase [Clostridiales bacterium]|nr:glutamyl-tRNA reductase [Clostridiales bacterium]